MRRGCILTLCLLASACSGGKAPTPPASGVKLGKPYTVSGQTYTPKYDPEYDETGIGSWYGPGFHGKYTANGEVFNQDDLTAAHTTLPLPSLVRVTNLENGKSQVIRVNDRGPFVDGRIIDLSRASAQALGINGVSRVRVQFLKAESEQYWASRQMVTPPNVEYAQGQTLPPEDTGVTGTPAPIMSVASADLQPDKLKIRPIQPSFKVVSDAEAAESPLSASSGEKIAASVTTVSDAGALDPGLRVVEAHTMAPLLPATVDKPVSPPVDSSRQAFNPPPRTPFGAPTPAPAQTAQANALAPGWYVQLGAFSSEANALALADKASSIGNARVSGMNASGRPLHRVSLGPVASRAQAEQMKANVGGIGIADARIFKE